MNVYAYSVTLGGWDLDFSLGRFNLETYMHSVTLGSWDSDSVLHIANYSCVFNSFDSLVMFTYYNKFTNSQKIRPLVMTAILISA